MLALRSYEHADAASVWRLHHEGLRQMDAHAGDGPWDDDLRSIPASYLESGGGVFLVGVVDGEVVAMGALRRISDAVGEIKRMRVDPRFQRRGFGRAVLRSLEQRACELGYTTLRLDTTGKQLPAQRLYVSSGYREVKRTRGLAGEPTIVFEKQLGPSDSGA